MLEGRGRSGRNGAIWEVLPTYDWLLSELEGIKDRTKDATREEFPLAHAIEDHVEQNVTRGHMKLSKYYELTGKTPVYYAAVVLHPRLKHYCRIAWADKLN